MDYFERKYESVSCMSVTDLFDIYQYSIFYTNWKQKLAHKIIKQTKQQIWLHQIWLSNIEIENLFPWHKGL